MPKKGIANVQVSYANWASMENGVQAIDSVIKSLPYVGSIWL